MQRRTFIAGVWGGAAGLAGCRRPGDARTIPEFARLSFSQQGEDIVLYHALRDTLGIQRPTYMDVGAAHPVRSNNTYLLYGTGSTGVLVEPNPTYVQMLTVQRPKDTVIAAGIGVTDAIAADYYEIRGNPLLNTFSAAQAAALQEASAAPVIERVSKMPLVNINRAIAERLGRAPDLLSTDVEGLDEAIIRALDLSRFRPGVICCEGLAIDDRGRPSSLMQYLSSCGYVLRGGSMVNSVFIDGRRLS